MEQEILEMLEKDLFKKYPPSDKFRKSQQIHSIQEYFKMEGLHCLKFLPVQDDLLCKTDLKEAYFSVPLNKNSQKFVRFQ